MNGITPFLWFNADAQAAIEFYVGLFPDSEIVSMGHYGEGVPGLAGKVMHAQFRLQGRDFFAMDAGPQFPFTEAISLFVSCENQAEVDHYWSALTADGGAEQPFRQCSSCPRSTSRRSTKPPTPRRHRRPVGRYEHR